jgi:4-amino-4-deoxy-L-arabinose transferase-like glycosyltransferase
MLRNTAPIVLFTIAVLLIAVTYFSPEIWQHGEAREALVIQDIVNHQRWVLPLRNGELPSKPILYHWIAASLALLLGLSDFTVRLPSAIAAMLLAAVTYSLGALGGDRRTALLAVGVLAGTFEFWDSGTEARVDMLFSTLVGAALLGWYGWYRSGREIARAAAYLAAALAVLVKGPAGVVLPALVVLCFLVLRQDVRSLSKFFSWHWVLLVVVIDAGWYLAAYQRGGADFWEKQIVEENFDRFFGAGEFSTEKHRFSQAFWLMTQLFPWSLVLVAALVRWVRSRRQDRFRCFLHTWWLPIFGFFLLSSGQRAVYLLPIYPAVALLVAAECAAFLDSREHERKTPRWQFRSWSSAAALFVMTALSIAFAVPITRTLEEDRSGQEEFVEEVVAKVPATALLYAAPKFPDTVLVILAYRLNRSIQSQPIRCDGDYYYLAEQSAGSSCLQYAQIAVSHGGKRPLQLIHVLQSSR